MRPWTEGAEMAEISDNCIAMPSPTLKERVRRATREVEAQIIVATLEQHRWNRRRTADALGISYRSLMYKMKNCNLQSDRRVRQSAVS